MKWTPGTLRSKTVWAEGLFTLHVDAPEVLPFTPGQFLQLGLDIAGEEVKRPYSVASPHSEILDFYIVEVEDGKLTPSLNRLQPGDSLKITEKAAGSFTLDHSPPGNQLWLIATGTGLAPYIAMLRTEEPWDRYQQIVVVHGVRYQADLSYVDEMHRYARERTGRFCYVPIVSREDGPESLRGRITHRLEDGSLEERAGVEFNSDCCILMCGNPDMLTDLEAQLLERGIKKHRRKEPGQIVVERYW
ncbi:MAG TPA: ferredoxin--NADP(+) reductase [Planctomycetaceae bacterium]|nr:ferredoxin--NADP(+) reductase [Planctomycetaceae bacterium]